MPRVPGPKYDLKQIRMLINSSDDYFIAKKARSDAQKYFGFFENDILNTFRKLRPSHYEKTTEHNHQPNINIDHYIIKLGQFEIYTHFHIEDNELAIISFKEAGL